MLIQTNLLEISKDSFNEVINENSVIKAMNKLKVLRINCARADETGRRVTEAILRETVCGNTSIEKIKLKGSSWLEYSNTCDLSKRNIVLERYILAEDYEISFQM